ncbi:type II toxin-antitoxin system RelE/ParE family toxin [Emcibacter sp.]|uniref:type II toxin-antitoxin system RelE/ParE family toxin n=1 Tax=Emcibacter sp. TaxID=1979954 RepID=UPI003A91508D
MKWSVSLTRTGKKSLSAQLSYIHTRNPTAARRMAATIALNLQQLSAFPKSGRLGRVKGTRELIIPRTPFIAVYRIKGRRVEVLRILHDRQNWPGEG